MQYHKERTVALPGLRAWRERAGMSQAELGRRAGLTASHVCRVENGTRRMSLGTLLLLGRATGAPIEELVGHDPCAQP